jgi:signal transduction histidine kinase
MNTVGGRLVLMLLLIHAVLMPALFVALATVIDRNIMNAFVDDARIHGRIIGDNIEIALASGDEVTAVQLLDSAILGGHSVYAAIQTRDRLVTSSMMSAEEADQFEEDFGFGEHGDDTYYISVPVGQTDDFAILRLGFDELPTQENLGAVRDTIVLILAAYTLMALLATGYLTSRVVRPLRWLQRASHAISAGEVDKELKADSELVEIRDLSRDLETMRGKLVGMYARLQQETADREQAEEDRRSLERQVRHAQRLESLGTLAGGVAHEFNNVLQPILLYTDLTREELPEDSEAAGNLGRVMDLARRAKALSNQILTFGRFDAESELDVTELAPVVEEALTMIQALLPATVDLRSDISSDVGAVRCDPGQIKQLLVNLCNNAHRALSGEGGYIEVSLKEVIVPAAFASRYPRLREGEYAVLQVVDTGCGMDRQTMDRAFEPFFTTQTVGEGTGLGLSVVHGIVMRHDGEIVLQSEPGQGAQFRIYLPLATEDLGQLN